MESQPYRKSTWDQYLFLETLQSGASQRSKYLQLSKVRSHAAAIGHRKAAMLKRIALDNTQINPASRKQSRSACTGPYRIGPSPQQLRPCMTKKSGDTSGSAWADTELRRDSPEHWQVVKRFQAGPQSLLGASRRDPFRTFPVAQPIIRSDELLDFGKSYLLVPISGSRHLMG